MKYRDEYRPPAGDPLSPYPDPQSTLDDADRRAREAGADADVTGTFAAILGMLVIFLVGVIALGLAAAFLRD